MAGAVEERVLRKAVREDQPEHFAGRDAQARHALYTCYKIFYITLSIYEDI